MDPVKVQGVTDWPQPTKVKDIQSFIGFVNFYQRFIWNFSEIAHPLCSLRSRRTGHGAQLSNRPSVRACPRPGVYVMSGYLQSSDISTRGHSRGTGPC